MARRFIAASFLGAMVIALGICSPAYAQVIGRTVAVMGYCLTEEAATHLAERISASGNEGYVEVMRNPRAKCLDTRYPYFEGKPAYRKAFPAVLIERLWKAKHKDGRVFVFFRAKDAFGRVAVVWAEEADLPAEPGQGT